VKKDGQVKEVRIVTRNAVLRTAYVSDDEGTCFGWILKKLTLLAA